MESLDERLARLDSSSSTPSPTHTPIEPLDTTIERVTNNPTPDESMGVEIMNELVKSYGFKYNEATGDWDTFSLDVIKQAYKDDPIWTAIDHITLGIPVAKWGTAAATVIRGAKVAAETAGTVSKFAKAAKFAEGAALTGRAAVGGAMGASVGSMAEGEDGDGTGVAVGAAVGAATGGLFGVRALKNAPKAIGKALEAGTFVGRKPIEKILGVKTETLFGKELGYAIEKQLEQSPGGVRRAASFFFPEGKSGKISQFFHNYGAGAPLSKEDLDIYMRFGLDESGHLEPGLDKHIIKSLQNNEIMGRAANKRLRDEALQLVEENKDMTPEAQFRFREALKTGVQKEDYAARAGIDPASPEARLFNKTFTLRHMLQQEALQLGMISPETYGRTLNTYHPRQYEELLNIAEGTPKSGPARSLGLERTIKRDTKGVSTVTGEVDDWGTEITNVYKHEDLGLTEIMDPKQSITSLMDSMDRLTRVKFARGLQQSPLVRLGDDITRHFQGPDTDQDTKVMGLMSIFKVGDRKAADFMNDIKSLAQSRNEDALARELSKVLKDVVDGKEIDQEISKLGAGNAKRMIELSKKVLESSPDMVKKGTLEYDEFANHYGGALQQVKDKILENNGWVRFDEGMTKVRPGDELAFTSQDRTAFAEAAKRIKAIEADPVYAANTAKREKLQELFTKGNLQPDRMNLVNEELKAVNATLEPMERTIALQRQNFKNVRHFATYADEYKALVGHLNDHYIEKDVAEDLRNFFTPGKKGMNVAEQYRAVMSAFRLGKTVYNPATWVRNHLGNMMSHSFVSGFNEGNLAPWKGFKAWKTGSADYKAAVEAGVIDSDFMTDEVRYVYDNLNKWEGKSFMEKIQWGMANDSVFKKAHPKWQPAQWYATIDKVSRLDAWIRAKSKYLKKFGEYSHDQAANAATRDVFRFYANFTNQSDFVNMARNIVPFSGFGAEAARFTKNALIYKPHMVFAWNHGFDVLGNAAAMATGLSVEDMEEAKSHLPNYTQGKKMLVLPWTDDKGKVQFVDMSYILPLGDMQNKNQGKVGDAFFAAPVLEMFNPMNNPIVSSIYAGTTGKDAYTNQPIQPGFTEGQLGIDIQSQALRKNIGLVEHMTRTMMPPMMPPGYVGINLLQTMRGTKDRRTGQPIQESIGDSVLTNLLGIRKYKPSVKAEAQNIYEEAQVSNEGRARLWDKWESAVANKNKEQEASAKKQIIESMRKSGKSAIEARKDFERGTKAHKPGSYKNVSEAGLDRLLKAAGTPQERSAIRKRLRELKRNKQ